MQDDAVIIRVLTAEMHKSNPVRSAVDNHVEHHDSTQSVFSQ